MRSPWWSLLLFVGACSFTPGGQNAGPDGPTDDGPTAPDDTAGPVDTDGDGIVDPDDNCPAIANADQRDHDSDLHGDACDHCPHLASAQDPDGDGDGVGDACDPRPTEGGDSIALWEGFYDDSTAATWTPFGGTWSVSGGALHMSMPQSVGLIGPPTTFQRPTVTTGFSLASVGTSFTVQTLGGPRTVYPSVALYAGVIGTTQSYGCTMTIDPGNQIVATSRYIGNSLGALKNWTGVYDVGHAYTVTQTPLTANHCDFRDGAAADSDERAHGSTAGSVVFYVTSSTADFDYLFVVETGGA